MKASELTRGEIKSMAGAAAGLVAVVLGVTARLMGGLTWQGFFGALFMGLYASVVVIAGIYFFAAYRRSNPAPEVTAAAPQAEEEPPAPSEGLEEPFGIPQEGGWQEEARP